MSWKEGFTAAMLRFTREKLDGEAAQVYGFAEIHEPDYEWTEWTFEPGEVTVEIRYRKADGMFGCKQWSGDFAALIRELGDE